MVARLAWPFEGWGMSPSGLVFLVEAAFMT
jgi:hypothetical protein